MPRFARFSLATALVCALFAVAGPVWAQATISIPTDPDRSVSDRSTSQEPLWINREDCESGDAYTFSVVVNNVSGLDIEVWQASPSVDCGDPDERNGVDADCTQLHSGPALTTEITITAREMVEATFDTFTADACNPDNFNSQGLSIVLHFMLIDPTISDGMPAASVTYEEIRIDVSGPPRPTEVEVSAGEEQLQVDWTEPDENDDVQGYKIFCDPPPEDAPAPDGGTTTQGPPPGGMGGTGTGGTAGAAAGMGGASAGASGAAGMGGTGTGGTSGGTGGSAGSSTGNSCSPNSPLVPGETPDLVYECGSVTGRLATGEQARNLLNGTEYAIGVAAFDLVGNVGPLSDVVCATPEEVDDFFELYRRAGGQAGGGFCSVSGRTEGGLLLLALGTLVALVRRRRGRSS